MSLSVQVSVPGYLLGGLGISLAAGVCSWWSP